MEVIFLNDPEDFIKEKIRNKLGGDINLFVKEWSLDTLVVIDIGGKRIKMYRVESFEFSTSMTFTDFTVTVKYPDNSMNGKVVITEVRFLENAVPPVLKAGKFNGATAIHDFKVGDNYVMNSSTKISIVSYIFDEKNYEIDFGNYANRFAAMLVNSHYKESSYNPWQEDKTYKLVLGKYMVSGDNDFLVSFQKRLNIKVAHNNWTENNPVISWDNRDDAKNGYLVLVLVDNKSRSPNSDDGTDMFAIAYSTITTENSAQIFSDKFSFTPIYDTGGGVEEPYIKSGDMFRVEIFVLDGTNIFSTAERLGAFYMDSLNIVR